MKLPGFSRPAHKRRADTQWHGPAGPPTRESKLQRERLETEAQTAAQGKDQTAISATAQNDMQTAQAPAGIGQPLSAARRQYYQQRYSADLSKVRIHNDSAAAQQTDELGANAFTHGRHIAMGRDYRPDTAAGEQLLAHELAHAAQQQQPGAAPALQCDDRTAQGIGRTPPSEPFTVAEGTAEEDGNVLFRLDNAELLSTDHNTIQQLLGHPSAPLIVHVHGYASHDGDGEYNLNLSAHRAVAVQRYIETLLPEGSQVVAYARGETREFGNLRANRRVGIDIIGERAGPAAQADSGVPSPDLAAPGGSGFDLDLNLRLDPELLRPLRPGLDPRLLTSPPLNIRPELDYGDIAAAHGRRGAPISERDARSYEEHFRFWRDTYIRWGLTAEMAAQLAQLGTDTAVDFQLSLEYPTEQERLDRMMDTEPTTIPIFNDAMMRWLFEQWR